MVIVPVQSIEDLYLKYPGELKPQNVHLILDCPRRTLTMGADECVGGTVSAAVYHGRVIRWRVPLLDLQVANKLMRRFKKLATILCQEYDRTGDLKQSPRALRIIEQMDRSIEKADFGPNEMAQVWELAEWLAPAGDRKAQAKSIGLSKGASSEDVARIAKMLHSEASNDGLYLTGVDEYLEVLRKEAD